MFPRGLLSPRKGLAALAAPGWFPKDYDPLSGREKSPNDDRKLAKIKETFVNLLCTLWSVEGTGTGKQTVNGERMRLQPIPSGRSNGGSNEVRGPVFGVG